MQLGVISDEVSQDIGEAVAFAKAFSLDGLELRSVAGVGAFDFDGTLVGRVKDAMTNAGLKVSCLSLPLFKCDIDDAETVERHVAAFGRTLIYAEKLRCRLLRGFCFWRGADAIPLERIAEAYARIIPAARDAGVTLVLESDPTVYGHTATALAAILRAIDDPSVRAVWDGGNYLFVPDGGVPCDEYPRLAPFVHHVHVKDAVRVGDTGEAVCVGEGDADVCGQFSLLKRDEYDGWVSLETHYRRDAALGDELMRLPGGVAFSEGAASASAESMTALQRILKEEGVIA